MAAIVESSANEITPEKLTLMKIKAGGFERDFLSEPTTPTAVPPSLDFPPHRESSQSHGRSLGSHTSLSRRSSRQVSSSRRSSSFLAAHRSKMSSELSTQAEGKFFALMDLMSTASREASSLKESWARIIAERNTLAREREELIVSVEEITETYERAQAEHQHHGREHTERHRLVEKLRLELAAALATVAEHKQKISDRDNQLERIRVELQELHLTVNRSSTDFDRTKAELEALHLKIRTVEDERDHARSDSDRHHNELRNLLREHTDLKGKHTEGLTKIETARKEVLTLTDRIKIWELERDEHLHEKDRLQEDLKRVKLRGEEASRELAELTERHDRIVRDSSKLKETIRVVESERDDHSVTVDNLRRELKNKGLGVEEADARTADITLKYEHIKREVVSVKEKLRDIEAERTGLREASERSREEHRLIIIERDQLKEDIQDERRRITDGQRRISVLEESLRRAEQTVTEVRTEIHTLTERNRVLSREGDDGRLKHGQFERDIIELKEKLLIFQAEIRSLTDARDRAHRDLNDWKHKYEEVTETITEFHNDSSELEFEIESLRTLLREAREQKERAIQARHSADRERDEYIAKYEEKCRELERFEESAASHYHAHGRSESGKSFTRTVSTSGTTVHNHSSKHGGSHSHAGRDGEGIFSSP